MKGFFKKWKKAVTVVMCAALVFETVNLAGVTVRANVEVDNAVSAGDANVSGNDASDSAAQTYEQEIFGVCEKALAAINKRKVNAEKAASSASASREVAETGLAQLQAADDASYEMYKVFQSVIKACENIEVQVVKTQNAYEESVGIYAATVAKYEKMLSDAQNKEAAVTGELGKAALEQAAQDLEAAKAAMSSAQADLAAVETIAEQAEEALLSKPVIANFYILNEGLEQPEEISHYPNENYSEGVAGELYSGVLVDGERDYSYIPVYRLEGVKEDVASYLKSAPTAEDFGITLEEGETITWYVIKTMGDVIHVDGIISGQKVEDDKTEDDKTSEEDDKTSEDDKKSEEDDAAEDDKVTEDDKTEDDQTEDDKTSEEDDKTSEDDKKLEEDDTTEDDKVTEDDATEDSNTTEENDTTVEDNTTTDNANNTTTGQSNTSGQNTITTGQNTTIEQNNTTPEQSVQTVIQRATTVTQNTTTVVENDIAVDEEVEEDSEIVDEAGDDIVQIEDEETALSSGIVEDGANDEVVTIEDEETPLAGGHCGVHWLILILTLIYTVFELVRSISRNKRINELKNQTENATV